MAPTSNVIRAPKSKSGSDKKSGDGLSITSVSVKKGHPTVVKYSWAFHDKSPDSFTVGIEDVAAGEIYIIDRDVSTRGHGKSGKGTSTADISVIKSYPGKFVLVLVDVNYYDKVFATSKAFEVKKSDF